MSSFWSGPRPYASTVLAFALGSVAAIIALALLFVEYSQPRPAPKRLEAYRILASYNALEIAAERAESAAADQYYAPFAANSFSATIALLHEDPYLNVVTSASLHPSIDAVTALANKLKEIPGDGANDIAKLAPEISALRPAVQRIAKTVSDENYRGLQNAMAALRASERRIAWFSVVLLLAFGFFITSFIRRNRRLEAKTLELQLSESKLQQLSFYRQQFLANMSHEFRTPLNAIRGFAEAIVYQKETMQMNSAVEYAEIISKSAGDLTKLTEDVLDLSKIDAGKFELAIEDVDLTALIDETLLQFREPAAQKNIEIDLFVAHDWLICCDRLALKRCVTNLLSNALKFSDGGSRIELSVTLRDPEVFVIEVRDFGLGIPERDLQSIWMVYARSSTTRKSDREGAGLGLAMVKALMDEHKGFVELQSKENVGTSARLCFPTQIIVASRPVGTLTRTGGRTEVSRRLDLQA